MQSNPSHRETTSRPLSRLAAAATLAALLLAQPAELDEQRAAWRFRRSVRLPATDGGATLASLALPPDVATRARPDLHTFSIEEVLERLRQAEFSYFRQISFVLAAIASAFSRL